ncbi:hypothetical protein FQA39_LY12267 [Lamprigera yunnana]|nr:hypothetical protein FQA39_LY12267 [Lamprigera yunnana]
MSLIDAIDILNRCETELKTVPGSRPTDDDIKETLMNWFEDCNVKSNVGSDCDTIESDHESDFIDKHSIDDAADIEENIETELVTSVNLKETKPNLLEKISFCEQWNPIH